MVQEEEEEEGARTPRHQRRPLRTHARSLFYKHGGSHSTAQRAPAPRAHRTRNVAPAPRLLLAQNELVQDLDRVLRRRDGVTGDEWVVVDFKVVAALCCAPDAIGPVPSWIAPTGVSDGRLANATPSRARTSNVLSPKKWMVLKPSCWMCCSAYVLSQPTGKMSNEIWPPARFGVCVCVGGGAGREARQRTAGGGAVMWP